MPYLGRNVISGFNSTLVILYHDASSVLTIVAISSIPSIHANGSPTQPLMPPPNGK